MLSIPRVLASGNVTVAPLRVVVIFVPGIMGSRLVLKGATDWDPDSASSLALWAAKTPPKMRKALYLGNTATLYEEADGLTDEQEERGWGAVVQEFYGDFLRNMQKGLDGASLPVAAEMWAVGYDWRQPNKLSAKAVLAKIESIKTKRKPDRIIVVTHSMGGIVMRHITLDKSKAALIEGVIHIGQPVEGAVVTYRRLLGGAPLNVDGDIRWILGKTPEAVAEIVSGTPSLFEMLPTDDYRHSTNSADFWLRQRSGDVESIVTPGPGETIHDLYLSDSWPPSAVPRNLSDDLQEKIRKKIAGARKAVKFIAGDPDNGVPPKQHKATWSILSTKVITDTVVLAENNGGTTRPTVHFDEGRREEGDGTVPAMSAAALFPGEGGPLNLCHDPQLTRQFVLEGVVHDKMCLDPDLQAGLLQLIFSILAPPALGTSNPAGNITFDGNLIWEKLFEVATGGALDTAAEIRVAKYYAQHGHQVHLLKERPGAGILTPDMTVSGIGNVEVKRIQVGTAVALDTMEHGMNQIAALDGGVGILVVVHTDASTLSFSDFHAEVHNTVLALDGPNRGIKDLVIREDALPEILGGP